MKNKYAKSTKISEGKFRYILRTFSLDISALTASKLYHINYRTIHRLYTLLRQRVVQLAMKELSPFAGEIELDESYFGARRVRGKNHVNGIESFWSYAKYRVIKLRGARKDKFIFHLKESEWRWNHHKDNIYNTII